MSDGSAESTTYRDTAVEPVWRVERRWHGRGALYPTIMTLGAIAGSVMFAFAPVSPSRMAPPVPWSFRVVAMILWVIAGIAFGWWALALHRNRTVVTVERDRLRCEHGPIRTLSEKVRPVQLSDVELFEVERRDPPWVTKHAMGPTWEVVARLIGGQRVPVVTRLPEERHAVWLQRKLDTMLV